MSVAVYGVDTFTAVNLLAFNRWSSSIEPKIPFDVSKWIFSACIIASWVNLGYEYLRATHAAVLRWAPPGYMMTMDFRADRVTVALGPDYKITKINCG